MAGYPRNAFILITLDQNVLQSIKILFKEDLLNIKYSYWKKLVYPHWISTMKMGISWAYANNPKSATCSWLTDLQNGLHKIIAQGAAKCQRQVPRISYLSLGGERVEQIFLSSNFDLSVLQKLELWWFVYSISFEILFNVHFVC